MSFEYIKIDDPVHQKNNEQRNQLHNVFVRPMDCEKVPVTLPNWKPEPCCLNWRYQEVAQQIKDMEVRPDDVWQVTYSKSGSTWCQEMIWLICNNLDYETAAALTLNQRFPFLEVGVVSTLPQTVDHIQAIASMASPRFIKTHLPVALLPDQLWTVKPRLVYVRRNPKSIAVSAYHHSVCLRGYKGTMDEYLESFVKDLRFYSPYHNHVIEYHSLDYQGNILYLCYEEMNEDLKRELKRVCAFFNKCYSDEQLDTLAEHLSFGNMKNNKSVNMSDRIEHLLKETNRTDKLEDENYRFIRKGKSDGWKTELTVEQQQLLDEWTSRKVKDPEHLKLFQYN